jgi:hypothetical protein
VRGKRRAPSFSRGRATETAHPGGPLPRKPVGVLDEMLRTQSLQNGSCAPQRARVGRANFANTVAHSSLLRYVTLLNPTTAKEVESTCNANACALHDGKAWWHRRPTLVLSLPYHGSSLVVNAIVFDRRTLGFAVPDSNHSSIIEPIESVTSAEDQLRDAALSRPKNFSSISTDTWCNHLSARSALSS